jgi:multidrug efflux pump subunit AcrA (membrane-fusion protein)
MSPLPSPQRRQDMAFLPAVMEVEVTPPSPLGRGVLWVICGGVLLALLWASLAKIDIHATANGRIVPSGRVKQVQPFEPGVVQSIHVSDGDLVAAGTVLVELDPADALADISALDSQLRNSTLTVDRLRAALRVLEDGRPIAELVREVFGDGPGILVLDEATSALDVDSEKAI